MIIKIIWVIIFFSLGYWLQSFDSSVLNIISFICYMLGAMSLFAPPPPSR